MNRFRISMSAVLMLVALFGILTSVLMHVHDRAMIREIVRAIELSPDRTRLARASDLGVVIFDVKTRQFVARFQVAAGSLAFSPTSNFIATGGIDGSVQVWNVTTGKLHRSLEGHLDWVRSIAFSADSTRLYSASRDGKVKVWQMPEGELVATYDARSGVESMTLSSDGRLLAVGTTPMQSTRHHIELWSTGTGISLKTLTGPQDCYVYNLSFGLNNRALAVGLSGPMVRIWDVGNGTLRIALPSAAGRDLVRFSPSGRRVVTGRYGGVQVWDTANGSEVASLNEHSGRVLCASFLDGESMIMLAGEDGTVTTWDLTSGRLIGQVAGLTVRGQLIPWIVLAVFATWVVVWCGLAYREHPRTSEVAVERGLNGFVLVLVSAVYFVGNGMVIMLLMHVAASESDPIGALFSCSAVSFVWLIGVSLTLVLKTIRSCVVFWSASVVIITAVLCHDLYLLAVTMSSV